QKLRASAAQIVQNPVSGEVLVYPYALGDYAGTGNLVETEAFAANQGTAFLADDAATVGPGHRVEVRTLDELFPTETFSLVKIDVEGHELRVIGGAQHLLSQQRIRHVVYEDHSQGKSGLPA